MIEYSFPAHEILNTGQMSSNEALKQTLMGYRDRCANHFIKAGDENKRITNANDAMFGIPRLSLMISC